MFEGKGFLVYGAGISGIGAVRLLCTITDNVTLYDGNEALDEAAIRQKVGTDVNFSICLGELTNEILKGKDIAVISPGIPTDNDEVMTMKGNGLEIWGEVELAYRFNKGLLLAITGTNGKTTTTSLVGEIMAAHQKEVFVTGNIGVAYTTCAPKTTKSSATVLEVSSFQLETTLEFHPKVSAILNITPDHLDRHHTFENYARAKFDITKNQTEEDVCVLNYDDELLRKFGNDLHTKVVYFSSNTELEEGFYYKDRAIYFKENNEERLIVKVEDLKLLGKHNYENVMAACAITYSAGVPFDTIIKACKEFNAVEHRIEFVVERNGVRYYNDSKGTNPDAAIKAVEAMERPTILIGGGYDKNSDYTEWIQSFGDKVKLLVLVGQTKEKIDAAAHQNGFYNTILCETFEEAVDTCIVQAQPGDAVLLSPACASWGMFKNYEERGRIFKELVKR